MSDFKNPEKKITGSNYLILGFFFLTGLTGLAYELVWIRLLILAFGSTQFAITTVLVVFMAGLAIGSLIFGRVIDRFHAPLKVYAAIEIFLGIYCVLSPSVFNLVRGIYVSLPGTGEEVRAGFEFAQFGLSFLALIIPTTLMGGTLPILVKYMVSSSGRVGFHTAVPYAVNTLGAVTGCLATGFFSLYVLGVKATVYAAGVVDIVVGVLVFLIFGRVLVTRVEEPEDIIYGEELAGNASESPVDSPISRSTLNKIILATFGLSGFCSLAYEVLWTRVFSLVLGSSIYAFTIMLATFLVGIGAGSIFFAPFIDRRKRPLLWFAGLEAVIGVTAMLSIFLYRELPFIFLYIKETFSARFWLFSFVQFILCAAIMIIPTFCMGAIFPLVGRIYSRGVSTVGKHIGDIYFFNTAGSIVGSFVGGFVLIPIIGVQKGVIIIVALNLAISAVLLNSASIAGKVKAALTTIIAIFFIGSVFGVPAWERTVMTMGLYVNPVISKDATGLKVAGLGKHLLYYEEGINAIITVRSEDTAGEIISYQANGKMEARAMGSKPAEAWALLGHIPMLLHKGEPTNALVVGLGSGITLGAMENYPLEYIDVVEIETGVVEASRYFSRANNNAVEDERAKLHITDGRSFLFTTDRKYDVMVSAVSDPWITGVSNLFTYEYFTELKNRLNADGIVSLWFQNYRITPKELKIGLNTFASVFPNVSVWFHYTDVLDFIVIGSVEPHSFNMEKLSAKFADQRIRKALGDIDILGPYDVLDLYLMGDKDLRRYLGDTVLNTDERPVLEFVLPKHMYLDPSLGVKTVERILAGVEDVVPPVEFHEEKAEEFYLNLGKTFNRSNFRLPQAFKVFNKVLEINPENKEARAYLESLRQELRSTYTKPSF